MNVVFDKKTLQVVSLFDASIDLSSEQEVLRSMFPNNFRSLSIWMISRNISNGPMGLSVKMGKDKNPEYLIYRGKVVYASTEEDKKKIKDKIEKEKDRVLSQVLPRTLRASLGTDIIKFWRKSPYTNPEISRSLDNFQYFSDEKIIIVEWGGPFTDAGGYANMNREIVFRMHNYHVIPKVEIWPTAPQISAVSNYRLSKYNHLHFRRLSGRYTKIHGFTPHPVSAHNGTTVFFTMMETETLHPEFVRLCNHYSNEVWVPSRHNKRVFTESGVNKPIYVMPLGIDPILYGGQQKATGVIDDKGCFVNLLGRKSSDGINNFRFLSLFGWSYRKGIDILIKSFVREFSNDDDVALIICSRHAGSPGQDHQGVIKNETIRYAREVRKDKYPQILLYPHVIPEPQMPSVYRMGHAFICCSRGEGFSLPQIEASASGLPVISCNNTGMGEYLTDDNAYLIKTDKKEMCHPEMHWISTFYHNQLFPRLGEEQIDQARKHMRYVLGNYKVATEKNNIMRKEVFEKYTWDKVAERVSKRIKEIR